MTDVRKRSKGHPALGGRIIAFGLSFSAALGLLSKLVIDRPQSAASPIVPPSARSAVQPAPEKIVVRIVHRYAPRSAQPASPRINTSTTRRVVRLAAPPPPAAPKPVTTTHAS